MAPDSTQDDIWSDILYIDAKNGKVQYTANGQVPDSTVKVGVTVFKVEDMDIQGEGEVVIKSINVKLKITEPELEENVPKIYHITAEPEMPTI